MHSMKMLLAAVVAVTAGCSNDVANQGTNLNDPDQNRGRIEVGVLNCQYKEGSSIVVKSQRKYSCVFQPSGRTNLERYTADVTTIGVDLLVVDTMTLSWAVLAPTMEMSQGVLAGSYAGVSAGAALGVGAGANVLIGGLKDSFTLQPLSISTGSGVGASVGVEKLVLSYDGIGDAI